MFSVCSKDEDGSPWPIFERLLRTHSEMAELDDMMELGITVAFMLRFGDWQERGRGILGMCYCQPSAQGSLRPLFEQMLEDTLGYYPDFLIILNGDWWLTAPEQRREILVFHEALHAGQAKDQHGSPRFNRTTGMPIPTIVPHDLEEFNAVAERYGPWKGDVAEFGEALKRFEAKARTPKAQVF